MGIIYEIRFPSGKYWIGCSTRSIDDVKIINKHQNLAVYRHSKIEECKVEDIIFSIRSRFNTRDLFILRKHLYELLDKEQDNPNMLPHRRTCL